MKKILTMGMIASSLLISQANADFLRVEMGAGAWDYKASGTMSYRDNARRAFGDYRSSEPSNNNMYVWMLIKHPVPLVPNLRVEYTKVRDSGSAFGRFEDFTTDGITVDAKYELKQYDIIPYYNILDNLMWTTIDLGIDIKIIDASYYAYNVKVGNNPIPTTYHDQDTVALPLAYARGRVEIPGTNIGLEADGKYVTYDGSTVYDLRAKVDYSFDFGVVEPGLEVGYRVQKFDLKTDDDKKQLNVDFSGFYAGLMLRF